MIRAHKVNWDIRREGRTWTLEEVRSRYDLVRCQCSELGLGIGCHGCVSRAKAVEIPALPPRPPPPPHTPIPSLDDALAPEKIELIEGKLFWTDRDRLIMLGLLLENVGVEEAIRLGDPAVWKAAITKLEEKAP
jgi:hypothetical protein